MLYALASMPPREAGLIVERVCDGVERAELLRRHPVRRWDCSRTVRATSGTLSAITAQLTAAKTHLRDAYTRADAAPPASWQPSPANGTLARFVAVPEPEPEEPRQRFRKPGKRTGKPSDGLCDWLASLGIQPNQKA
jgi:hypothetical protein